MKNRENLLQELMENSQKLTDEQLVCISNTVKMVLEPKKEKKPEPERKKEEDDIKKHILADEDKKRFELLRKDAINMLRFMFAGHVEYFHSFISDAWSHKAPMSYQAYIEIRDRGASEGETLEEFLSSMKR